MARDYYISASGNDAQDGTLARPWRTFAPLAGLALEGGDQIFLDSRAPHYGSLVIENQSGSELRAIRISAYGSDKPAEIRPDTGPGVLLRNCSHIHVSKLHLIGAGYPENQTHGLCLFADEAPHDHVAKEWMNSESVVHRYSHLTVDDIEVEKFGCAGVAVGSQIGFGLQYLEIQNVRAHDNAYAGIFIFGPDESRVHQNIAVRQCQAYDNTGIVGLLHLNKHGHHSGHGIFMSCVDHGLIENSKAFRNGALNTAQVCGPAGIWAALSRDVTIRKNESFQNRTAGAADGGGFGFDGGMLDSVMSENLSYENDGSGYLMAQYYGAPTFANNRFENNVSRDDGRHNDNGAIHIWCPRECRMSSIQVRGNRVETSSSHRGRPRALFIDAVTENLEIAGNEFSGGDAPILLQLSPGQTDFIFTDNRVSGTGVIEWRGQTHKEVSGWLQTLPQI